MSRTPINLGRAVALGVGLIVAGVAVAVFAASDRHRGRRQQPGFKPQVKKGLLLCPSEEGRVPANVKGVQINDYAVIKLLSADRSFTESAWGRVVGRNADKSVLVLELTTSLGEAGLKNLSTDRHGFGLGERINVKAECIYDLLPKPDSSKFTILCGLVLVQAGYEIPKSVLKIKSGDTVRLVIGSPSTVGDVMPGTIWKEEILATVVSLGKTGDVIRGIVRSDPSNPHHDLKRHNEIFFTRDCIVEVWG